MICYGDTEKLEASEILYNSQLRFCFLDYKDLIYFFSLKVQALFCVLAEAVKVSGTLILANFGVKLLWRHFGLK